MMKTSVIRRELRLMAFSTEHARITKANIIAHLLGYERSIANSGEIDLVALYNACQHIAWLCNHVQAIDDKQVLPSQRVFLADAYTACYEMYEKQSGV